MNATNPFSYGNPLSDPRRFIGRRSEIEQIYSRLRNPEFESSSLIGERRMGKTSILNIISRPEVAQSNGLDTATYVFVYMDLQMLEPDTTPTRLYQFLLRRTGNKVEDPELKGMLREISQLDSIDNYDLSDLFDVFDEKELHLVLLLDEFENIAANGNFAEASVLREQAYEGAPETAGKIGDEKFAWICDGDTRVGPFLEAIVNGGYYWVPFERLAKVEIDEPTDLRDFVWAPAMFTWANGGQAVGFIPSRYPGTIESTDPACLLCRRTEWIEQAADTFYGMGQRVLCTDVGEYSLLDVRTIEFQSASDSAPETPSDR